MNNGKLILNFVKRLRGMLIGELAILTLTGIVLGGAMGIASHTVLVFYYRELAIIVSVSAGILGGIVMSRIDQYVNNESYRQWLDQQLREAQQSHQRAVAAVMNCYNTKGDSCGGPIFVRRVKCCHAKGQSYKALLYAVGRFRDAAQFQNRCNKFEEEIKFVAKQCYGKEVV